MKRDQPKKQKQKVQQPPKSNNNSTIVDQSATSQSTSTIKLNKSELVNETTALSFQEQQSKHDQKHTAKETTNLLNFFQDKQINILQLANSFGLNVDKKTDSSVESSSISNSIENEMGKKKNQNKQQAQHQQSQQQSQQTPQQQQIIEEQLSSSIANDENCSFLNLYLEAAKLKSNETDNIKFMINDKQQQQCNKNLVAIEAETEDEEDDEV